MKSFIPQPMPIYRSIPGTAEAFILIISLFALVVSVIACAPGQFGITKPVTTEDKIMTAYATVGARYQMIADLAIRKVITKKDGLRMIAQADEAKSLVENADKLLTAGSDAPARQSIALAEAILTALEKEAKERTGS